MASVNQILVEVAYATVDQQLILELNVDQGTTIKQAIEISGVLERFPEINLKKNKVGIFGKLKNIGQILQDKDRIEIYRPLIADPKEARRRRAAAEVLKRHNR
jgi:putative ubiquitin-RnfH superfamily antitoxin RatB of RatAB toxin-antitoxin module